MNQMLELSEKNFKVAIIKMFQKPIANSLETNEKIENLSKEIQIIKIPSGNDRTKITITEILKLLDSSVVEWRRQRIESENLRTEQKKENTLKKI